MTHSTDNAVLVNKIEPIITMALNDCRDRSPLLIVHFIATRLAYSGALEAATSPAPVDEAELREIYDEELAREIRQAPLDRGHAEIERLATFSALRRVARLRALPPAQDAVRDAWQPIETAPKSVRVLVYVPRKGRNEATIVAAWNKTGSQWWAKHMGNLHPTHWMPLPEPPLKHANKEQG